MTRFMNIPEEHGENCIDTIYDIIERELNIPTETFSFKRYTESVNHGNLYYEKDRDCVSYQSHCEICHTDYRVTLRSSKIAPKTRYFGWNIACLSQSSISFSNVAPEISLKICNYYR